jgi:hypothetical protein
MRHFKERTPRHEILDRAHWQRFAGLGVYALNAMCGRQEELLAVARDHYPPPVKDIEHAIFAAAAG